MLNKNLPIYDIFTLLLTLYFILFLLVSRFTSLSAEFSRHCVFGDGSQRRALLRYQSDEIFLQIFNILFLRVGIELATVTFTIELVFLAHNGHIRLSRALGPQVPSDDPTMCEVQRKAKKKRITFQVSYKRSTAII